MNEPTRVRDLTIADDDWMNGGDNADHLTTILVINGTFHHLEAIRVIEDEDGRQHAARQVRRDRRRDVPHRRRWAVRHRLHQGRLVRPRRLPFQ
jgi:hypothetical protein